MNDADAPSEWPVSDPVTGAYPRALLLPQLDERLVGTARDRGRCSVFLFDVDFFKTVNDAYGHPRGDRVLHELADQVKIAIRPGDTLYRYGGDEFVVVLPGTGRTDALRAALHLTDEIRRHEFEGEPPLHLSISLGVATYPQDGSDAESLLACADRRNYLAKRRGRDTVVGDDVEADASQALSRLLERDIPLRTVHEFLTRLQADGTGALSVTGEPGSGHTRFLADVATIAALRGFVVATVPADPAPLPLPRRLRTAGALLLIADVDAAARASEAVDAARAAARPAILGLVYASTNGGLGAGPTALPIIAKAELKPWSTPVLRIWLRNTLLGEPSRVLLSWVASESGGLPAGAERALHRLRARNGLVRAANGGWTVSAAVLGRPARRTALPVPLTALLGREHERDQVVQLLGATRLVTLVGPGGIGKTRLALAVAATVAERFDGGAVFVPLADTTDSDQVVPAIAKALQVTETPGQALLEAVTSHLAEASLLLVLDNFEQVVDAARVISEILAAAPGVSALVTSRERLAIYGEHIYRVPPLPLPDLAALPVGAGRVPRALAESPAIALFEQRARAAEPEFALTAENLPVVTEVCRRLDGLPLAIELAAARADRWQPTELLEHLGGHIDVSDGGLRDRSARQKTLGGAIDWSYALLDPDDRTLFDSLAVFVGGAAVEAVIAVAPNLDRLGDRLDLLGEKSLLIAESAPDGTARYRLLETIRSYAVSRLSGRAEVGAIHRRHAEYFVAFAERCGEGMTGPGQADWIERLERDYGNLRAALDWLLGHGEVALSAPICLSLWWYWRNGNNISEGREWLAKVLADAEGLSAEVRARLLYAAAALATSQDDHETVHRLGHQSLKFAGAAGDRATMAQAHNALGIAAIEAGEYNRATEHFQQSLRICEDLGQAHGTAIALGNLTKVALRLDDIEAADVHIRRCLQLERAAGNSWGLMLALNTAGQIRLAQHDIAGARADLEEGLQLSRTLSAVFGEATALHWLGLTAQAEGDHDQALRLLVGALARRHEVGDREDLSVSLERVAGIALADDPELAARLLAAAGELRRRHRLPDPPESETQREATLTLVRERLDERTFAAAWEAGRATPLDRIIDQVLDLVPPPDQPQ